VNRIIEETTLPEGQQIQIIQGDLTQEQVDGIVNAANAQLQHGAGVAGAISSKGGPTIQAESNAWVREHGPVKHAAPAYTRGGNLPCRYVIHAVGPIWQASAPDQGDIALAAAVEGSLALADHLQLKSLAIPAISTGIFGFPKERAARVMLTAMRQYFEQNPAGELRQVRLVLYDQETLDAFRKALPLLHNPEHK